MDKFLNSFFLFYFIIGLVWIYRSRLAAETLNRTPQLTPVPNTSSPHAVRRGSPTSATKKADPSRIFGGKAFGNDMRPRISVLIPAKNEQANIEACLTSLFNQDYENFEVIVINDNSTDRTEEILKSFTHHPNFTYLNSPPVPEGWTGKNHALFQGVKKATGRWFLFTDADTRHHPAGIRTALAHAEGRDLSMLSLLPRCLAEGFLEKMIQPFAMALMGLWFPMTQVNNPRSGVIFANGQYLLMTASLYQKTGGHEAVRGEFLEDFALMRKARELGERAECAIASAIYGTRMYHSWQTIWRGWRRIYLHSFRKNSWILLQKTIATFFTSVLPFFIFPWLIIAGYQQPDVYGLAVGFSIPIFILILAAGWKGYGIIRAKRIYAVFHPIAGFVITLILADAARMALTREKTVWR